MRLLMINTPNRVVPDQFPPYAILSLNKYMRKHGISDVDFYNVDIYRPEMDDLVEIIKKKSPDVLGISAVVSTSYKFTKEISLRIKEVMPETIIILGGNLAASAEIVLRKTGVDFCALGEGETILLDFMNRTQTAALDYDQYKDIPGLVFLDNDEKLVNTGYGKDLPKEEIYDIDIQDLGDTTSNYIYDMFDDNGNVTMSQFEHDKRVYEPHRKNKKYMVFIVGKGCVAKCTFCHRWDKGIRHIPVNLLMDRLDELIEKYDVGFINTQIEAFACDKKWLYELCDGLKKRDILWYAGAVRAKSVNKDMIDRMDDAGCVSLIYGLETGSPKMLEVMEKKTTLEENIRAQELTIAKGYYATVLQFVIGMPGESPTTIKETTDFSKYCMTLSEYTNPHLLSINYAQALPGTPLYEYARKKGYIGTSIDDEEKYLLFVSDRNAADPISTLNFTEYPMIVYWSWKYIIYLGTIVAYIKKYGIDKYYMVMDSKGRNPLFEPIVKGDVTMRPALWKVLLYRRVDHMLVYYPMQLYRARSLIPLFMLLQKANKLGIKRTLNFLAEYLIYVFSFGGSIRNSKIESKSLRKTVNVDLCEISSDSPEMMPLRKGRW